MSYQVDPQTSHRSFVLKTKKILRGGFEESMEAKYDLGTDEVIAHLQPWPS